MAFDAELHTSGVALTAFHIEAGLQDFQSLALALARELDMPLATLRPYLRGWYEGARYTLLDMGVDVSGCDTEEDILDALAIMEAWEDCQTDSPASALLLASPTEVDLRTLMGQALTAPTPDAIMHFAGFANRMCGFGPFNVQMIYAQRPGAGLVATRREWEAQGRTVRRGAIPIVVLRPMGPIEYVFEELDTDPPIQRNPASDAFAADGPFDPERLTKLIAALAKPTSRRLTVRVKLQSFGANLAGWINRQPIQAGKHDPAVKRDAAASKAAGGAVWDVAINGRLTPAEQFVTLLHELGHLFCGHLGAFVENNLTVDEFGWPDRSGLPHATREIEAELVAWWLANREGLTTGSPLYLRPYLEQAGDDVELVDLDRVTRAVARVRGYLGGKP